MSELSRRLFLNTCLCSTVSIFGKPIFAIEPIANRAQAKFKYSLAAYSYRKLFQAQPNPFSLFDFIDDCAKLQLEGTELTSYYFPENVTTKYLHHLKRHAFQQGLSISGTAIRNDFGFAKGSQRTKELDHVKRWIEYAAELSAPVIRIFAGHQKKEVNPNETQQLMVSGMQQACEFAAQHGVHLALENHGGPTATAAGLLSLVKEVDSPWFGVNLDTGNFHSDNVYDEIAEVAPYALNVQVKVVTSGPDKLKSPTDYARLASILSKVNYRGFVVLEFEEVGDPRLECAKHLQQLKTGFASIASQAESSP